MTFSNSGTVTPIGINPKLPPFAADPGSSEYSSAIFSNSSPEIILSLKFIASFLAVSISLIADGEIKICLVSHCFSNLTSGPLLSSSFKK